jgi:hypothetical protein
VMLCFSLSLPCVTVTLYAFLDVTAMPTTNCTEPVTDVEITEWSLLKCRAVKSSIMPCSNAKAWVCRFMDQCNSNNS